MKMIDALVTTCIQREYVEQEKAAWLHYALERRLTSLLAFIPLLVIGFFITNPVTLIAFYITFSSLRSRTNGIHARTIMGCIVCSAFMEVFFLKILPTLWNPILADIVLNISIVIIWKLAPYNHPNMALSEVEMAACARSAKRRLVILLLVLFVLHLLQEKYFASGILLGIAMTASTLAMAYYPQRKVVGTEC